MSGRYQQVEMQPRQYDNNRYPPAQYYQQPYRQYNQPPQYNHKRYQSPGRQHHQRYESPPRQVRQDHRGGHYQPPQYQQGYRGPPQSIQHHQSPRNYHQQPRNYHQQPWNYHQQQRNYNRSLREENHYRSYQEPPRDQYRSRPPLPPVHRSYRQPESVGYSRLDDKYHQGQSYPPPDSYGLPPDYQYQTPQKELPKRGEREAIEGRTPLFRDEEEKPPIPIKADSERGCTDVICTGLLIIAIGVFVGLLIYGLTQGDLFSVVSLYNSDRVRCNQNPNFPFGFLTTSGSFSNAICVAHCPSVANVAISCLSDSVNCIGGTFTPTYTSFALDTYCIPNQIGTEINLETVFNLDSMEQWAYDLSQGWEVLLIGATVAIFLSLNFFVMLRWCTGAAIWGSITLAIGGLLTDGIFFILEAKGEAVPDFVSNNLSALTQDTLLSVGSIQVALAGTLTALVACMRKRISMGAKTVELGSAFLVENKFIVILPIVEASIVMLLFSGVIAGGASLYSLGEFEFPSNAAIPSVFLESAEVAMVFFYLAFGLMLIFFIVGCNNFLLCSAVSVWYFSNENWKKPFCDSFGRMSRYHLGSVFFASVVHGILFVVKILANLFSFQVRGEDNSIVSCLLQCFNACFCLFKMFLRFLTNGAYVQIAIEGEGYCASTTKAYDLLTKNTLKATISEGIIVFFVMLGVAGISGVVAVSTYFSVKEIPYYKERIQSPLILTFVGGAIAFVISGIYLSMVDIASASVLQCYLVDQSANGRVDYASQKVKELLRDRPEGEEEKEKTPKELEDEKRVDQLMSNLWQRGKEISG